MKEKELTPYYQGSYGDSNGNGFQGIYFYTTYHGIPHLIVSGLLRHEVKSEKSEVEGRAIAPNSMVAMRIKRPGEFWTNIYTSKEVGCLLYTSKLPVSITQGYIHLGDGFILLGASLLGWASIPAAAIGSALAEDVYKRQPR